MNEKIIDKLPGLAFHTQYTLSNFLYLKDPKHAMVEARYEAARLVAGAILDEPKFFTATESAEGTMLDIRLNCYVLTAEELRAEFRRAYVLGAKNSWFTQTKETT